MSGSDLLGAAYDPEDDAFTAIAPSSLRLSHGTLSYFNTDGSFQYTPDTGYVGPNQFTYQLSDGLAQSPPIVVALNVNADPSAKFINDTRGGDKVVSAQDTDEGLPGGQKTLDVEVTGGQAVTLTIKQTAGASGSAVFIVDGKETTTRTVPGGKTTTITIYGREVSDVARNMQIQATIGGKTADNWTFTVFEVTPTLMVDPATPIKKAIPASVKNDKNDSLQALLLQSTDENPNLGHHQTNRLAYGGMVLQGKVTPTGINPNDFNQQHSRDSSFNWTQTAHARLYLNGASDPSPIMTTDQQTDGLTDGVESLKAAPDLGTKDLFIWSFDVPRTTPNRIPNQGNNRRLRAQFYDVATYAGVQVVPTVNWYWDSSQKNNGGDEPFVEDATYNAAGDNKIAQGSTGLTIDLGNTKIQSWSIIKFQPGTVLKGQKSPIKFTLNLSKMPQNQAEGAVIYLIREEPGDLETKQLRIPLTINKVSSDATSTTIEGTFPLFADPIQLYGPFTLKVLIMDTVNSLNNVMIRKN